MEDKKLSDVLHLYKGAQVQINIDKDVPFYGEFLSVRSDGDDDIWSVLRDGQKFEYPAGLCKLCLNSLYKLSEKDKEELAAVANAFNHHRLKGMVGVYERDAAAMVYLLGKGYDLFELLLSDFENVIELKYEKL